MNKCIQLSTVLVFIVIALVINCDVNAQVQGAVNPESSAQADPRLKPEGASDKNLPKEQEPINEGNLKEVMTPEEYQGFLGAQAYAEENSKYTLGPTDVIEIAVMRHPEVSGQYTINNEGKIQYEFVGDLLIAGLTKKEVQTFIAEKLSEYIINPELNVKIIGYNSKIVYVIGEVGAPGKIFMRGDTMTVREALLQAGLPLLSANTRKLSMFTPSADGKVKKLTVDVHKLLMEGDLRENYVLKPGDTLYLPATFWAKAMRVINPVAQPIGTAVGTGRQVYTGGF